MSATTATQEVGTSNKWSFYDLFVVYDMTPKQLASWTGGTVKQHTIENLRAPGRKSKTQRETAFALVQAINKQFPPAEGEKPLSICDVVWPNGISDEGRPPGTSPIPIITEHFHTCGMQLPTTGVCHFC